MTKTDQLASSIYFSSPIYSIEIPEWVDDTNKICDKYIKEVKKNNIKAIKEREKKLGKKIGDHGMSHHSGSLIEDPTLKELQEYIGSTSWNILDHMGYDLTNYELFWTEFWVLMFFQNILKKKTTNMVVMVHMWRMISTCFFCKLLYPKFRPK